MGIECGALPTEKGSVEGFQTGCDFQTQLSFLLYKKSSLILRPATYGAIYRGTKLIFSSTADSHTSTHRML